MSNDKIDPSNWHAISSADDLVKTIKSADAELTENELANVTGGKPSARPVKYMEFKLKEVLISGVISGGS
jgi:bacteriocin-like protein